MNFSLNNIILDVSILGIFVLAAFSIKPLMNLIKNKNNALNNARLTNKQKRIDQREIFVLNLLEQAAKYIVALVAQNPAYSLSERFTVARNYLLSIADKHGMQFLDTTINGLVESAFQNYKNNIGGDIHTQVHDDTKQRVYLDNNDNNDQPSQHKPH
ncbi:phage holin, LLH family [Apilactobacillus micheneri]|nr:phage holin, LLH family [Apilactobacillus micheneri]